jgi:hypothetical protein
MADRDRDGPKLTIVGGQPAGHELRRRRHRGRIEVPVGLEKTLFHAARDEGFRTALLTEPRGAIERAGIKLRPSEQEMLSVIAPAALEAMIDSLVPGNPRRRRFMGLVAAAAASLAAGTAAPACDEAETEQPELDAGGIGPDTDVDGDTDTDTDADSDSDSDTIFTDTDTNTATEGIEPDTDVDGGF